jgi:hypothetical protein
VHTRRSVQYCNKPMSGDVLDAGGFAGCGVAHGSTSRERMPPLGNVRSRFLDAIDS